MKGKNPWQRNYGHSDGLGDFCDGKNVEFAPTCEMFALLDAIEGCGWFRAQEVSDSREHAFYTFGVRYEGAESIGFSWLDSYRGFWERGGDGVYKKCMHPYNEPVFQVSESLSRIAVEARAS